MKARIFHNPKCSKSRASLALLQSHGIDHEIVEYLVNPPDEATLVALIDKLGLQARDIVRFNEQDFKDSGLDRSASNQDLIHLMLAHPKLIERPIVEYGEQARIGRPPEQILELFR